MNGTTTPVPDCGINCHLNELVRAHHGWTQLGFPSCGQLWHRTSSESLMLEYWIPCTVPPHHIKRQTMILSLLFATIYASELKLPIFSETKNAGFTALKGRIIKCNWECRGNENTQQSTRCFRHARVSRV